MFSKHTHVLVHTHTLRDKVCLFEVTLHEKMLLPEATSCQIKSPVPGVRCLPSSCWLKVFQNPPNNAVYCYCVKCPPELYCWTQHTLWLQHMEKSSVLTRKILPCWLACIVLKSTYRLCWVNHPQQSSPAVNPVNCGNDCCGKIGPWV